ncbi:hypothetical protein ADICYQ_3525 [Cyclobacterium qasimii M12-11B]|uniref:Uncharacterized protein n=1 Tax=Cyclobacterium qasimii M12-11B TaxID=641524 RepID=S7VBY8_9BACT|nr:hypothetical protein ADICYQ_3525 [Cyclobacterium qasimii M12-11B]
MASNSLLFTIGQSRTKPSIIFQFQNIYNGFFFLLCERIII